jgi:Fe-S cluster biosynthesis and repair protein YggX
MPSNRIMEGGEWVWYKGGKVQGGIAAPVNRLLHALQADLADALVTNDYVKGIDMTRTVKCAKLGKELEGLERAPLPGPVGERIYEHVSKEAWQQWLRQQTILINEYRLSVIDPKAREFLEEQMLKFLFEGDEDKPQGYVPPSQ